MDPKEEQAQNTLQTPINPVSNPNREAEPIQEVERPVSDYSSYPAPPQNLPETLTPAGNIKISDDLASQPPLRAVGGMSLAEAATNQNGSTDRSITWLANEVIKEDKKFKKAA
jgi:hypothetical protein